MVKFIGSLFCSQVLDVAGRDEFFEQTLPAMVDLALRLPTLCTQVSMLMMIMTIVTIMIMTMIIIAIMMRMMYFYLGCLTVTWCIFDSTSCVRTKFCLFCLPAPVFFFYFQAIPLLKQQQNHSLTMSQEQVSVVIFVTIVITNKCYVLKDGAYYCYCAYVLRISRYSSFLSVMLTNTGIFLRGLKLSRESR